MWKYTHTKEIYIYIFLVCVCTYTVFIYSFIYLLIYLSIFPLFWVDLSIYIYIYIFFFFFFFLFLLIVFFFLLQIYICEFSCVVCCSCFCVWRRWKAERSRVLYRFVPFGAALYLFFFFYGASLLYHDSYENREFNFFSFHIWDKWVMSVVNE